MNLNEESDIIEVETCTTCKFADVEPTTPPCNACWINESRPKWEAKE
ncbi:MAG: hypothetical protein KAS32_13900 [Candidatus Peribacteraceae bacterium]|nr:hypothetical protein [Candidatus Peribacteraceae bacterium]